MNHSRIKLGIPRFRFDGASAGSRSSGKRATGAFPDPPHPRLSRRSRRASRHQRHVVGRFGLSDRGGGQVRILPEIQARRPAFDPAERQMLRRTWWLVDSSESSPSIASMALMSPFLRHWMVLPVISSALGKLWPRGLALVRMFASSPLMTPILELGAPWRHRSPAVGATC